MSTRPSSRPNEALRPVTMQIGFHSYAEGSVLYRCGKTVVLCTASVEDRVPPFLEGKGKGWVTAEYQMHPRANPQRREARDGRGKAPSGRTQEIQRLVGRALRAAVDLDMLGERTVAIDCDVLEADGGTRTASITGAYVALAVALDKLRRDGRLHQKVLHPPVAATSVGWLRGELLLDLEYVEDSKADVDLNVVATADGAIVEVQGTAEGTPIPRVELDRMIDLGLRGVEELTRLQTSALALHGTNLADLLKASAS
jgi:ribonuclease PH